jgi:hypothetical protein
MIATVLMASCAGTMDMAGLDPVIGQSATPAVVPAQPSDARCDGSLNAAQGFTVSDTGACPGMMPAVPTCAADFKLCSGFTAGATPSGTLAGFASSDGAGDLLLSCSHVDTPVSGLQLFSTSAAGYGDGTFGALGSEAAPMKFGFSTMPASQHDAFMVISGSGATLAQASPTPNLVLAGTDGAAAFWVAQAAQGLTISMQRFAPDGTVRAPLQTLLTIASGWVLGGAMDINGHTLLLVGVAGEATAQALWMAPDGHAETALFTVSRTAFSTDGAAALPGGGVALGEASPAKWNTTLTAGSTQQSAAPGWLASRGSFQIIRGGTALLFSGSSGSEIVTPDGTSCGTLSRSGQVGLDGTFISTSADQTTFRAYPELLR